MFVDMDESFGQKKDLHNVYKINLFTKMSFALEYCILSPDMKRIKRFVLKKKERNVLYLDGVTTTSQFDVLAARPYTEAEVECLILGR